MYTKIFIIILILILFILINFLLKKKKEKFGVYCGRYNLNKGDAEKNCKGDDECNWFKNPEGTEGGWCGQNPEGARENNKNKDIFNIFSDNISTEENNMSSNLKNQFGSFFN